MARKLRFRKGLEVVDIAFPRFVPGGDFGGTYDYVDPVIMETHKVPVKPISSKDWQAPTYTISAVFIYFPATARFDYAKPEPENPGMFLRVRGQDWHIDGNPEIWKFGGSPHIKVSAKREAGTP